jgi:hypothetical protein
MPLTVEQEDIIVLYSLQFKRGLVSDEEFAFLQRRGLVRRAGAILASDRYEPKRTIRYGEKEFTN